MSGRTPVAVDADGNVRLPVGQVILRAQPRALIVGTVTALAVLMAALVALAWGDYPLSVPQVVQALLSDQGFATRVVTHGETLTSRTTAEELRIDAGTDVSRPSAMGRAARVPSRAPKRPWTSADDTARVVRPDAAAPSERSSSSDLRCAMVLARTIV